MQIYMVLITYELLYLKNLISQFVVSLLNSVVRYYALNKFRF